MTVVLSIIAILLAGVNIATFALFRPWDRRTSRVEDQLQDVLQRMTRADLRRHTDLYRAVEHLIIALEADPLCRDKHHVAITAIKNQLRQQ